MYSFFTLPSRYCVKTQKFCRDLLNYFYRIKYFYRPKGNTKAVAKRVLLIARMDEGVGGLVSLMFFDFLYFQIC